VARLWYSGFETQLASSTALLDGECDNSTGGVTGRTTGSPTFNTSVQRSGAACLSNAAAATFYRIDPTMVLDRTYWVRGYYRFSAVTPSTGLTILQANLNAINVMSLQITASNEWRVLDANNATLFTSSGASIIVADTWYQVEMELMVPTAGNGTVALRIDGKELFRSDLGVDVNNSVTTPLFRFGWTGATAPPGTLFLDDMAFNDNQGASQNSWCGPGKIVFLKPTAATPGTSWEGPQTTGADTTNLHDNVDNTPPLGVAHADTDANALRYVFNAASVNSNFDATCATYASNNVRDADWISCVQAVVRASTNSVTGTNDATIRLVSGPADAGDTTINLELSAIAGTEPTGWKSYRTPVLYDPIVGETTAPVVRIAKNTGGSTRAWMADLMGVLVEYHPSSTIFRPAGNRNHYLIGQ
jgi:hypothetical protein